MTQEDETKTVPRIDWTPSGKSYSIKECFYSPQGEGSRVGQMHVFLRFAGCNLQCTVAKEGFNCDTDFAKGIRYTLAEVVDMVKQVDRGHCRNLIFTGGEPALQLDVTLQRALKTEGYRLSVETNGTRPLLTKKVLGFGGLDYVACSPKPGSAVAIRYANEVRCVVQPGQAPDPQGILADHYFVSPACWAPTVDGIPGWRSSAVDFRDDAIAWAVKWCEEHPMWRVSLQTHKILGVR